MAWGVITGKLTGALASAAAKEGIVGTVAKKITANSGSTLLAGLAGGLGLSWLLGSSSNQQVQNYRR